jgi:hypothetical protein
MLDEIFEWDENKNKSNFLKHGISFNEAQTVFSDDLAIYLTDDRHSEDEQRFIVIGESARTRLLVVCHCYRESETVIRLISARKAEGSECELYYGGVM